MTTRDEQRNSPQSTPATTKRAVRCADAVGKLRLLACAWLLLPGLAIAIPPQPGVCPLDFNIDGYVDEYDAIAMREKRAATPGDEDWDARYDLTGDLFIGSHDSQILMTHLRHNDCSPADLPEVPKATMWTGTAEFHDSFCPDGDVSLQVQDPGTPGTPLYSITLEPEECLRAPVAELAFYACVVNGDIVDSYLLEPVTGEYVSSEGNHVCDPADPVN